MKKGVLGHKVGAGVRSAITLIIKITRSQASAWSVSKRFPLIFITGDTHMHTGARMSHAPRQLKDVTSIFVLICALTCVLMCRYIRLPGAEYATASLALDLKPPHVHELHPAVSYASAVTDRRRTSSSYVKLPPFGPSLLGNSDGDTDLWGRRGQVWCTMMMSFICSCRNKKLAQRYISRGYLRAETSRRLMFKCLFS